MIEYVSKSKRNGPKCFPNFGTVRIVKLSHDIYAHDKYQRVCFPTVKLSVPLLPTAFGGNCHQHTILSKILHESHLTPRVRRHHLTPRVRRHHLTLRVRRHHNTPRVRRHHLTSRVSRPHLTPRVRRHHLTPRVRRYFLALISHVEIPVCCLSLVTRNPVFGVCDQVRLKPACSASDTS